jgi:hypothetical protein
MGYATLPVHRTLLERMFALPEDYRIVSVNQYDGHTEDFIIESPQLPDVPDGMALPRMTLHATVEYHPDDPDYRKIIVVPKLEER